MGVNLSIKDVPEPIAARLRERAASNHRSLQGELMAIVEAAAQAVPAPRGVAGVAAKLTVEQIAAERGTRFPHPVRQGPLAVDIVRADRDRR